MDQTEAAATEPEIVVGTREQLLHLLAEAAEIEHTLMCSYLYAAFSLKRTGEPGVSEAQGEALDRWRKAIIGVAVEEMGHLVIAANLTVAIGGRPHFTRPNFPVSPGYFPSGVAVRLAPFTPETLKHFIFLERPLGSEGSDSDAFDQENYSREQAQIGLMPTAQDYATVSHLYEAVRANLIALERQIGGEALFIGQRYAQIGPEVIDLDGVKPIACLADALAAIDVIVEQGEGSPSDRERSHYRTFLTIRDELAQLTRDDPAFTPAWPAADSPVLRRPPAGTELVFVEQPEAARLLDLACSCYGLLLRCLVQCFDRPEPDPLDRQKTLMSAAILLMHVVGQLGSELARLPAGRDNPGINAGLSFTMLRGVEPLLPGEAERRLLVERASELVRLGGGNHPEVGTSLGKVRDKLARL